MKAFSSLLFVFRGVGILTTRYQNRWRQNLVIVVYSIVDPGPGEFFTWDYVLWAPILGTYLPKLDVGVGLDLNINILSSGPNIISEDCLHCSFILR